VIFTSEKRVVAFCHYGASLCHKIDENRLNMFGITSVEPCSKWCKISLAVLKMGQSKQWPFLAHPAK